MSVPCKSELSLLNHDEREVILSTHHPVVGEMERDGLESLRARLRDLRDREPARQEFLRHGRACKPAPIGFRRRHQARQERAEAHPKV